MKKLILIILLLLVTGCTSEYTLKISNDSFKENIKFVVNKQVNTNNNEDIEDDDQLKPFIEEKVSSVTTDDKFYKKKIKELEDYTNVELSYNYDESSFKNSNSVNLCFEYPDLNFDENYYIHLQGAFNCLYSESVDIKIVTSNKVYYNNADEVDKNTYIWHIDESNSDYVDIEIEIDKGISRILIVIIILVIFILSFGSYFIYKIYRKRKYEDEF